MEPKISFVVTARNDDYGGNWTNRINTFIKVLIYQTNRLSLPCELVFVEYNPPKDKPHIFEALTIEDNKFLRVRFLVVPSKFHETLPDHEKVTVCEFIGKNIGMRRSRGEWIVATNPDVLYSDSLFDFFASGDLRTDRFYRINRTDLSIDWVDPSLSAQDILKLARGKEIKVMLSDRTLYVSWREWLSALIHGRTIRIFLQCPAFNPWRKKTSNRLLHANAAGDFLMAHRDAIERARGYDQMTVGSGVLDGYILYVLHCNGISQEILPYPLYHIYHHHKGVKYLASHEKFREDADRMLRTGIPYKTYPQNWGFPEWDFEEIEK